MIEYLHCTIDWNRLTEQEQKQLQKLLAKTIIHRTPDPDTFEYEIYKLMTEL